MGENVCPAPFVKRLGGPLDILFIMAELFLSRADVPAMPGAAMRTLAGWRLKTRAPLPVADLCDEAGRACGWLIGWPTDVDGSRLIRGPVTLTEAKIATVMRGMHPFPNWGGRFLAVVIRDSMAWSFPDACASLTVFYSGEKQAVGTDWALLDDGVRYADDVIKALNTCRKNSGTQFPFSVTDNPHVRPLLPSHALDLNNWKTIRFWPRAPINRVSSGPDVIARVRCIAETTRAQMSAFAEVAPLTLNLTAGRDSRMLLACARPLLDRIVFTTDPGHSETDYEVAQQLTRLFSLTHVGLPAPMPERISLPGYAGEVGRSFYWRKGDQASHRITTDDMLDRLKFTAAHPKLYSELEAWRSGLPDGVDTFLELDLLYLEWRVGCTMSPVLHGRDQRHLFSAIPLNHPHVIQSMMELPIDFRSNQGLVKEICRQFWPELSFVAFNASHFIGTTKYHKWWQAREWLATMEPGAQSVLRQVITRDRSVTRMVWDDLRTVLRRLCPSF